MLSSEVAIVRNPKGNGSKGRTGPEEPDVQQHPGEEEQDVEREERQAPAERGQPLREPLDGRGLLLHLLVGRDARGRLEQPVRLAEALADDGEHVERGAGVLPEQALERLAVDLHRSGGFHGHGVGGPFRPSSSDSSPKKSPGPSWPSTTFFPVVVSTEISTAPRAMT
jgi:hypothetical protein